MEDKEYWKKISDLTAEMAGKEREIFDIALDIDNVITGPEAEDMCPLIFKLWEAVAHYKAKIAMLEVLETIRFQEMVDQKRSEEVSEEGAKYT